MVKAAWQQDKCIQERISPRGILSALGDKEKQQGLESLAERPFVRTQPKAHTERNQIIRLPQAALIRSQQSKMFVDIESHIGAQAIVFLNPLCDSLAIESMDYSAFVGE